MLLDQKTVLFNSSTQSTDSTQFQITFLVGVLKTEIEFQFISVTQ